MNYRVEAFLAERMYFFATAVVVIAAYPKSIFISGGLKSKIFALSFDRCLG